MSFAPIGDLVAPALERLLDPRIRPAPYYDPPFESPLEDHFAYHAVKYLARRSAFEKQSSVFTPWGVFRMDFVVEAAGRRVGIECDGREFHNPWRDEWRDALILGTGGVDAIYRLPGRALHNAVEACLYGLATYERLAFSKRGRINLRRLVIPRMRRAVRGAGDRSGFRIVHAWDDGAGAIFDRVERHSFEVPTEYSNPLLEYYAFALSRPARSVDELIAAYEGGGRNWAS